jgi:hypothetical protein
MRAGVAVGAVVGSLVAGVGAATARAGAPDDVSASYLSKTGELGVFETEVGLAYHYASMTAEGAPACHCAGTFLPADSRRSVKPGEVPAWGDFSAGLRLAVEGKTFTLAPDPEAPPSCCPTGWTGDALTRKKAPETCSVTPERALVRDIDAAQITKGDVYVSLGDRVEVLTGPVINGKVYWLVRLPRVIDGVRAGMLRSDELSCR